MKKSFFLTSLIAAASTLAGTAASAQTITSFTAGDFVVDRVGDGTAALSSAGTAVFLDEYTPAGAFVGSYALPTAAAGSTLPLVESGTASSDGNLSVSTDGQSILIPGYNAALGTAGVASAASTAVPREVAVLGLSGTLAQQYTTTSFSTNNIRGAASANGSTVYASGGNTGIISLDPTTTGGTGTIISTTSTNNRGVAIYNNQLYLSSGSGAFRVATVGTGVPTTTGQTAAEVPGISSTGTPAVSGVYGFVATSLGGTATDTIYVADNGNGVIDKFSLVSGSFTLTGTATLTGVTGLTGFKVGTTEQLVATTPAGVFTLTDASGAGGTLTATTTQVATAATNEGFRGVAFLVPGLTTPVPEPSTWAVIFLGVGGVVALTRRSRAARS